MRYNLFGFASDDEIEAGFDIYNPLDADLVIDFVEATVW